MSFTDCYTCEKSFTDHLALDLHMKKFHEESERDKIERKMKVVQQKKEDNKMIVQKKKEDGDIFVQKKKEDGEKMSEQEEKKCKPEEIHKFKCSRCKYEFVTDAEMEEHMKWAHNGLPEDDKDALKKTSELSAMFEAIYQKNPELFEDPEERDETTNQVMDLEESEDDDEIESAKTTTYTNKGKGKFPKFPEWEEVEEGEPQHQGMLLKGKSNIWISATLKVKHELENNLNVEYKDEKGRTLTVIEANQNSKKPFEVEVVTKAGERGNANIVFHGPSKKKGVTVQVSRSSGHEFKFVSCVAKKFLGVFLNLVMKKGAQGLKDITKMRNCSKKEDEYQIKPEIKEEENDESLEDPFKCLVCGKICQSKSGMKTHFTRMHANKGLQKLQDKQPIKPAIKRARADSTERKNKRQNIQKIECKICEHEFPTITILNVHIASKHSTNKCNMCDYSTNVTKRLEAHKVNKHSKSNESDVENTVKLSTSKKVTFKPNNKPQKKASGACENCDEKFTSESRIKTIQLKHAHYETCPLKTPTRIMQREFKCNQCEFVCKDDTQMKLHKRDEHDESSPSLAPKEKKFKKSENDSVKNISIVLQQMEIDEKPHKVIKVDSMEIVTEQELLSMRMDKKVIEKQKKIEEEENTLKEKFKNQEELKEVNKRKTELLKMKNKQFEKEKEIITQEEIVKDSEEEGEESSEKVPERLRKMFQLKGWNIDDFCVIQTGGGGKCGSLCISLHITHNSNTAEAVRKGINTYMADNWENKFDKTIDFPYIERVGRGTRRFENVDELKTFLLCDPQATLLWMTHNCLQSASNMQNMNINILTTGVVPYIKCGRCSPSITFNNQTDLLNHEENVHNKTETEEEKENRLQKARWTILNPDTRSEKGDLKSKSQDMFLLHEDDVHYSLMAHKAHNLFKRFVIPPQVMPPKTPLSWAQVAAGQAPGAPAFKEDPPTLTPAHKPNHVPTSYIPNTFCMVCEFQLSNNHSLQEHMKIAHIEEAPVSQAQQVPKNSLRQQEVEVPPFGPQASKPPAPSLPLPPFVCNFCKYAFSSKLVLHGHMKMNHLSEQDLVIRLEESNKTKNEMSIDLDKAYTKIRAMTEEIEKLKIENNLNKDMKKLSKSNEDAGPPPNPEALLPPAAAPSPAASLVPAPSAPAAPAPSAPAAHAPARTSAPSPWDTNPTQVVFSCEPCQFTCSSKVQLIEHTRKNHIAVPKHKCSRCKKEFTNKQDLKEHTDDRHGGIEGKQYNCFDCDFEDNSKEVLMNHRRIKHSNQAKLQIENGFQCRNCHDCFEFRWQLMEHKRVKHPDMRKPCVYDAENRCSFSAYRCWYKHINETPHKNNNQENNTNDDIDTQNHINVLVDETKCFFCPDKFKGKNNLMNHRKNVHPEKCKPCENFVAGNCSRNVCWFSHRITHGSDVDFHMARNTSTPP